MPSPHIAICHAVNLNAKIKMKDIINDTRHKMSKMGPHRVKSAFVNQAYKERTTTRAAHENAAAKTI